MAGERVVLNTDVSVLENENEVGTGVDVIAWI